MIPPRSINKVLGNFNGIVGVALTGVPIFAGLSESSRDPWYPASSQPNIKGSVDECLGDANSINKFYHYLSYSPCLESPLRTSDTIKMCSDSYACSSTQVKQYMQTDSAKSQAPLGIALDGRKIYGMFKSTSQTWADCDVDVCNGRVINGDYSYVMTPFHPYTVGCWGPGNQSTLKQTACTTNARSCVAP